MVVAEFTDIRQESGFVFPEKLVDQNCPTTRHYDALLRGLTHKMNNLLAVIQGFSSLVLMQEELDEISRENLQQIKEAAGSASGLGERVLPAGGCARVDLNEVPLKDAVPLLLTRLRNRVESADIPFHWHFSRDLPVIIADQDQLRIILDELVKNAIEAAGPSGEVTLEIASSDGGERVNFFVRNTGSEMAGDQLLTAFKAFYSTKDSSHMGLGLTTAHVLAGHMGMDLGVKSENGETTFWLRAKAA